MATACFFLAGCVVFEGSYDQTIDQMVTELNARTETAVAQADAGQLSAADREGFYNSAIGTVRVLITRASLIPKNVDETNALKQLEQRYSDLQSHHLSPRTSVSTGLRATLLSIQQIEISKKHSAVAQKSS